MKANVGGLDRFIRLALGAILIGAGAVGVGTPWTFVVGGVLFGTALVAFCPLYPIFKVDTSKAGG